MTHPELPDSNPALPHHVAIVMDGNERWAQQRSLPRTAGHREGAKAVRRVVQACSECGIKVLTLFAFSSENWRRPQWEVDVLMKLFAATLRSEDSPAGRRQCPLTVYWRSSCLFTRPAKLHRQGHTANAEQHWPNPGDRR